MSEIGNCRHGVPRNHPCNSCDREQGRKDTFTQGSAATR
jgi:hypothetical protein